MSKTYRANLFARVLIPVFCALVAAAGARQIAAQEILPPDPGLCPTLEAADIWQAKESPHQIRVFYPSWLEVDRSSLGAGDILVTGPNGFERLAEFVSADYVPSVIPLPLPEDEGFVPVQRPALVATYAISPPLRENGSRAWTAAANGTYAVRLRAEQVALLGGGFLPAKLLGSFRVAIGGEPVPVQPVSTEIHIQRIPVPGADGQLVEAIYAAQVELTFATPHVRIEWEDLVREGDSFIARATAVRLPGFANIDPVNVPLAGAPNAEAPDMLPVFTKRFELGDLPAGDYRFVVRVNGERTGVNEFSVSGEPPVDLEPPKATLRTGNVMAAGGAAHRFRIAYEDRSGIDLDSLEDGDAVVQSPCLFADILPPFPCNWEAQRARLVEIAEVSASGNAAVAVYEIDAPAGGWSAAHNGFYTVVLANGEVSDTLGNANLRQVLGGFEVAIEPDGDPPVPAEVTLRVDASNPDRVRAHAHVQFLAHYRIVSQRVVREGNQFQLRTEAEPLNVIAIFPPPPPPQEDLTFELGSVAPGEYSAVFFINGRRYTGQEFKVGEGEPIPAQVAMEIVTDAPGGVHAAVAVQFETPHLLVPGEVRRDGSRIVLPARAEPIPVPDGVAVRPGPITVEYPIGNLPPGAYLAVFEINGHPYAAEDFRIDDPGEPIPAEVALRFDTGDPAAVKAFAIVEFRAPYVITGHRAHRDGNAILLEASAAPLTADHGGVLANAAGVLPPNPVILEFPLGELPPGVYFARFVMNGFPYAAEDFRVEDSSPEFEAEVDLRVDATDPGAVDALAHVVFANPFATIVNPGEPRRDGSVIRINAEAALRDGPPPGGGNNENAEPSVADLSYSLGSLAPGGYTLVFAINGRTEARAEFTVRNTPIPAEVELKVDVSTQPVTATAVVQFRDHYRIAETAVEREGNRIILVARAEGPLPILSPLPPQPITLTFKLGELAPGGYLAVFEMNGATYAAEDFRVGEPGDPFEADVKLEVAASNDGKVRVKAVVDFVDPFVVLVEPGEVVRDSAGVFHIRAAAAAVQFFAPPDGAPQTYTYEFEADPGEYSLVFSINGNPEAHARFAVPGDPPPPVPHVAHIDIAQGNASWFAEVGVILLPGQEVVSWGEVRTDGRQFFVEIEVEWVDFPPPIDPIALPGELPDGVAVNAAGDPAIGGVPVRLVTHSYVLGILEPGEYAFNVMSGGTKVARQGFIVPGMGPAAELRADNITEPKDGPHRFTINFRDPDGLDHGSIQDAAVVVTGRDGFERRAELVEYASTDDILGTGGFGVYQVAAPGDDGAWDPEDSGRYCVRIEREKVLDLQGHPLANGELGCFAARILPEPPEPPGAEVLIATRLLEEEGIWVADVEIRPQGVNLEIVDWGELITHGQTFVALATAVAVDSNDAPPPPTHSYRLGALRPGFYTFAFKTNLGHCGVARLHVPGMEGDPVDNWRDLNLGALLADDGDGNGEVAEYVFALNPNRSDQPRIRPEIVEGTDGRRHFGIRFRRALDATDAEVIIEISDDMRLWREAAADIEIVEQRANIDGTVEILACLRASLAETGFPFARLRAVLRGE